MTAKHGYGVKLKIGDGQTPETLQVFPGTTKIDPPFPQLQELDSTANDSADAHTDYIGGLIEAGVISADFHWDPKNAIQQMVRNYITAKTNGASPKVNWEIEYPDGAKASGQCLVLTMRPTTEVRGVMMGSLQLRVCGKITFTD